MNICLAISDVDWTLTKDAFSLLGTAVSLIGVIAAVCFGAQGLSAWKKQLRGSTDHGLAMEMLISLYQFRDSISAAREPVFIANSLNFGGAMISMERQVANYEVLADALRARHEQALSAKARLEAAAIGCEAAWGNLMVARLKRLQKLYSELEAAVKTLLIKENPQILGDAEEFYVGLYRGDENIAFDNSEQASSAFTDEFLKALYDLESSLKSKL
jgi:hypothetical protein